MLIATYDPAGVSGQVVDVDTLQDLQNKTLIAPYVQTDITLEQTTADYTLTWDNPAGARAISIPDPLGTDEFVFADMVQTLAGKTLTTPTIASFLNATHDHTSDAEGGTLPADDIQQTASWVIGDSTGMQTVTSAYTTAPLTATQESTGTPATVSAGAVVPPADGTYYIDAGLSWVATNNDGADKVDVKWQVFNSVSGLWEDIPGHI